MKVDGRTGLFLLATVPLWAAGSLEYTATSPGAQEIDGYLARKQSPMAGLGESLSGYSRQYNVNPRLVIAISGAETTFGRHLCADNNAWNWFHHRNCAQSPFENYPQGAERVTRFMRSSYLNRGYTTIELIRYKYCTSGCENWISLVTAFHDEMPESRLAAPAVAATPDPVAPGANRQAGTKIFGIPAYWIFFSLAGLVGVWSRGIFKR